MAKNEITHVYLNGRDIGTVEDPQKFVDEIRSARRTGVISGEINVAHYAKQHYININSDRGRVRKPYVIIENGKSKLTKDIIEKLKSKEINFNYLFRNGIVSGFIIDCMLSFLPRALVLSIWYFTSFVKNLNA